MAYEDKCVYCGGLVIDGIAHETAEGICCSYDCKIKFEEVRRKEDEEARKKLRR